MKEYQNHSGGAAGADLEWDNIGGYHGFNNHKHYRPSDLKNASPEVKEQIEVDIRLAALSLGRPLGEFPGKDFVRRNWFQAQNADAIFAVSRIIPPLGIDKGFVNNTGRAIVSGGTAWACEIAIQKGKPVHVFDMQRNNWYIWKDHLFMLEETPILTENYAGIGSRQITKEGLEAIRDVYIKTKEHDRNNV